MFLLLPLVLASVPVFAPTLSPVEAKRLESGEVVVRSLKPVDDSGIAVEAIALVDAPPTEVWPVVRDCQHFGSFMPRTKAASLVELDGHQLCHAEVAMPFPLQNLWSDSSTADSESPSSHFRRTLTLVRGTYTRNTASWTVVPWGEKSLVVYTVDTKPKIPVPDVIMRSMQGSEFPVVFTAVRARVVALRSAK